MERKLIDQGGFAGARCAGDADEMGFARVLEKIVERLLAGGAFVFDLRKQARQCEPVALENGLLQNHAPHPCLSRLAHRIADVFDYLLSGRPGSVYACDAELLQLGCILIRDDPANENAHLVLAVLAQQFDDARHQGHVGA